jgi:hypothetical protein
MAESKMETGKSFKKAAHSVRHHENLGYRYEPKPRIVYHHQHIGVADKKSDEIRLSLYSRREQVE